MFKACAVCVICEIPINEKTLLDAFNKENALVVSQNFVDISVAGAVGRMWAGLGRDSQLPREICLSGFECGASVVR